MSQVAQPLVSILLIAYNQQDTIGEAIAGALAQTYSPLEILISDDASSDGTFAAMQAAIAGYAGPHRVRLNCNERNLGIGAHLSRLVAMSRGELLVVAAGDDVSLPQRCERIVAAWLASGRKFDLIASALEDIDAQGRAHARIVPSDLASYRNAADWIARPPFVVGAAQAWTRRLFDRFGPLPEGVVAEDLLMVFRAIVGGGAMTLAEPLVRYRRGGISRRRRAMSARQVVVRLLKNNRHSLIELPQLLADARVAGQLEAVEAALQRQLAREVFIRDLFAANSLGERARLVARSSEVPLSQRLRFAVYAICPALLAPLFWAKRLAPRRE
ncbi:MAG: glycosyltransferase [Ideonella sp.]|nr:glycosyltransferase [Ideonella sp.]MBP6777667.1 glycosyltransferase [Piscinibacter sp.]